MLQLKKIHTSLQTGLLCGGLRMSERIKGIRNSQQIQHVANVGSCSVFPMERHKPNQSNWALIRTRVNQETKF